MKCKKKKFILIRVIFLLFLVFNISMFVFAIEPNNYNTNEQIQQEFVIEIPKEWQDIINEAPITIEEFNATTPQVAIENFLNSALEYFITPINLFAKLCAVIILVSVAKSFVSSGLQSEIFNIIDIVSAISIFTICSYDILQLSNIVKTSLEEGRIYISSFIPIFTTVMMASGQSSVSLVYNGMFFAVCTIITSFFIGVILPVTRILLAMYATSAIDSSLDLSKLANLAAKWIKWILTIASSLFVAILSLQTVLANNVDSAAIKAGKFLLGSSIPVVGRAVSDAMGSVLAGMKLIKGTLGFAAIAVIAASILPIVLKCTAYYVIFVLSSFISGATGNVKTEKLLNGCAVSVGLFVATTLLFAAIVITCTGIMIIVSTGG